MADLGKNYTFARLLAKETEEMSVKKILTSCLLVLFAVCVVAQTDTISVRVHELEGVTVTENRRLHTVGSTAPMHLLDHHDMLTMGVTDMADALHRLPGITLRDYGGAGGMKTVSVRGFGAKHTGVSYDGVMISECQSGEIDLSRYSLDNVGHLTLVIGDNDDIFIPARQATTPATLTIQTLRLPTDDSRPHLTAQLKQGSFGLVSPFLRYEHNFSDHFAFSAVGEYTYADNDYPYTIQNVAETLSDHRQNSRMNAGHGELSFAYHINKVNRLSGKLYYYDNDRQLPGQVRYYTNLSGETLHDRNAFGQLLYQTRCSEQLSLKWLAKFNWAESVYKDRLMQGGVNDASYWQREGYLTAAALWKATESLRLSYATDYLHNDLNCYCPMAQDVKPSRTAWLNTLSARWNRGFLSATARILRSVYINHVERGTAASDYRHWSPSLSASARLGSGWQARVMWKDVFRMPSFNELYFYHRGDADLKPERTSQWNAGLTWQGRISTQLSGSMTIDGYVNKVKDKIVCIPFNLFISRNVNAAKVRVKGADLSLGVKYDIANGHALEAQGHYSYMNAEDRSSRGASTYGKQIAYTPEHNYSAAFTWRNPWVNISLTAYGVSKRWATNEHTAGTNLGGYSELGTSLFREFQLKGRQRLTASLSVSNLLNKQYEVITAYPMPGTGWRCMVRWEM